MSLVTLALTALVMGAPAPLPQTPGLPLTPPERTGRDGAPLIYNFTPEAGPDQSFFLVGERLTAELAAWGLHPDSSEGREIKLKVQVQKPGHLIATVPQQAYDGPIVVWAKNNAGYSSPIVLNQPQPWWCTPEEVEPEPGAMLGGMVRVFGRCLQGLGARRLPLVYVAKPGEQGRWLDPFFGDKHQIGVRMPHDLPAGKYQLWLHAGGGGQYGWGGPLDLAIRPTPPMKAQQQLSQLRPADQGHTIRPGQPRRSPRVAFQGGDLQAAVSQLARSGGTLALPSGRHPLAGTLFIPANVCVEGNGPGATILVSPEDPAVPLARVSGSAWNQGPGAVHTPGDTMAYSVQFPAAGTWQVWLRYATEMSAYKQPGVSKQMTLTVADGRPVELDNLPNTGSFGTFKWSRSATVQTTAGRHEVVWKNVKGGGIHIDAFVFSLDANYKPSDGPLPESDDRTVVVQAEDTVRFQTREGSLPGGDRAAVWLAGDGAAVSRLTIQGSRRTNLGVVLRSPRYPEWIRDCEVSGVTVCGHEGKQGENCGIRAFNVDRARIENNELWGRAPIFLSGIQRSTIARNRLVSVSLWGGNAEAYILGRNDVVRKCVVEDNTCACPPGAEAGGPTGRRLLWFSTGRGSVDLNWIANNREDRARFGGVAGTDQNVGEMILFEACQRIAFYGPLAGANAQSVTLPARLPATPDQRLGSVKREQLAHDAEGRETPFWPPETDQGTPEPVVREYFVTILRGRGMGQTRRILSRTAETYLLEEPWRVPPEAGALAVISTAYWRNHIVGNRTVDGMTGVQLWISCIENVLSGNTVARMRKPGLYLYGNCTTLASSMPPTWNRGIGPLYFNHIEGTRADETSCGALVVSGEMHDLPVEFPRCLGNVLRHNSFVRSRTEGLLVTGSRRADPPQPSPVVLGTIAEFNVVRDALAGYRVAASAEATLLRRNHAYFWYPVSLDPGPRVAFQVDEEKASVVTELNSVEGIHGGGDPAIREEQRGTGTKK